MESYLAISGNWCHIDRTSPFNIRYRTAQDMQDMQGVPSLTLNNDQGSCFRLDDNHKWNTHIFFQSSENISHCNAKAIITSPKSSVQVAWDRSLRSWLMIMAKYEEYTPLKSHLDHRRPLIGTRLNVSLNAYPEGTDNKHDAWYLLNK